MQLKKLSLAIFSTLLLTACGGSSDSSSGTGTGTGTGTGNTGLTTPKFQQWTSFYIDEYSDNNLDYEIEQLTFNEGKAYFNVEETTGWDSSQTFSLTANGHYDNGAQHPQYGYLNGTIQADSKTWQLMPHSPIGSKDLFTTIAIKEINISGQPIAPILSPSNFLTLKYNLLDTYTMGKLGEKFYKNTSVAKFPSNSTCIQYQTVSNSKEYIELYKYSLETDVQEYLKAEWKEISSDKKYTKKTYKDATAYLDLRDDQQWGLALYKDKYYEVDYHPAGKEYELNKILLEIQNRISTTNNSQEKEINQELYKLTQNTCHAFNEVAAKEIRNQMDQIKN